MDIKINLEILQDQIEFLDMYASVIGDEEKANLVDGVVNLLGAIEEGVRKGEEIYFQRVYEN